LIVWSGPPLLAKEPIGFQQSVNRSRSIILRRELSDDLLWMSIARKLRIQRHCFGLARSNYSILCLGGNQPQEFVVCALTMDEFASNLRIDVS
jgi:hypothetical protein